MQLAMLTVHQNAKDLPKYFKSNEKDFLTFLQSMDRNMMRHQWQNFAYLKHAKSKGKAGAILADSPGMGKTRVAVCYLCHRYDETEKAKAKGQEDQRTYDNRITTRASLVIVPAETMKHWKEEIKVRICIRTLQAPVKTFSVRNKVGLTEKDVKE